MGARKWQWVTTEGFDRLVEIPDRPTCWRTTLGESRYSQTAPRDQQWQWMVTIRRESAGLTTMGGGAKSRASARKAVEACLQFLEKDAQ